MTYNVFSGTLNLAHFTSLKQLSRSHGIHCLGVVNGEKRTQLGRSDRLVDECH